MNVENIRKYARINRRANEILEDGAEDIDKTNQVASAKRDMFGFQKTMYEILAQVRETNGRLDGIERRLNNLSIISIRAKNSYKNFRKLN